MHFLTLSRPPEPHNSKLFNLPLTQLYPNRMMPFGCSRSRCSSSLVSNILHCICLKISWLKVHSCPSSGLHISRSTRSSHTGSTCAHCSLLMLGFMLWTKPISAERMLMTRSAGQTIVKKGSPTARHFWCNSSSAVIKDTIIAMVSLHAMNNIIVFIQCQINVRLGKAPKLHSPQYQTVKLSYAFEAKSWYVDLRVVHKW